MKDSNVWTEPNAPGKGRSSDGQEDEWERLEAAETEGVAAVCAARLAKGDVILAAVPMSREGQSGGVFSGMSEISSRYGISIDTADQYRRVAAWFTPERRQALQEAGVVASYSVLRDVALHTHGSVTDSATRFEKLLKALSAAAESGQQRITRSDYLRELAVEPENSALPRWSPDRLLAQIKQCPEARRAVIEEVQSDPITVTSVMRAMAEDPQGPDQFIEYLAQEGGLDALTMVKSSLRKATTEAKVREARVFGNEEESSPLEEILRSVLRAMKALEKPMDFSPGEILAALPPEQFAALNRLCGTVAQWHELLLAAARAADIESEKAA
ncbi:hypothetical protein ACFYXL_33055 [Streptomyces tsukubensis]|uniref:hypothetical protein n=1 Tax=Streptomyces tsukubensis TaxID=83656 RepID=UPI0036B06BAE